MNSDSNPEISALRNQVFVLLVALVVVTGTLTVYLYRQASTLGKQLAALRPQAQQLAAVYNQDQPQIVSFVNQLVAFGEKNPDFTQRVLKKYGIAPVPGIPAGSPAPAK
jgi:hypothetical protein